MILELVPSLSYSSQTVAIYLGLYYSFVAVSKICGGHNGQRYHLVVFTLKQPSVSSIYVC